jgi:hypothetical protein
VSTATSSEPTLSSSGPPAAAPLRAARISPPKSTLVVPDAAGRPSSAAGSRSSRACTPQQDEKDSARSRSALQVTTGSWMIAASFAVIGVKYRVRATAAQASRPGAATAGSVRKPLKKYGCAAGPASVTPPLVASSTAAPAAVSRTAEGWR